MKFIDFVRVVVLLFYVPSDNFEAGEMNDDFTCQVFQSENGYIYLSFKI